MKILMRKLTSKSGRQYKILSQPVGTFGFRVWVKIRMKIFWIVPIWRYLHANGTSERFSKRLDFSNYKQALEFINSLERINP